MQELIIRQSDRALPANQALYEDEDGCPFAAPQKPKPAPAKFGAVPNFKGRTSGGIAYIEIPVAYLAQLLNAVYGDASLARLEGDKNIALWIADGAPELDAMSADLDALRSGEAKPVARLTPAQLEELESECIGAEYSESPWQW